MSVCRASPSSVTVYLAATAIETWYGKGCIERTKIEGTHAGAGVVAGHDKVCGARGDARPRDVDCFGAVDQARDGSQTGRQWHTQPVATRGYRQQQTHRQQPRRHRCHVDGAGAWPRRGRPRRAKYYKQQQAAVGRLRPDHGGARAHALAYTNTANQFSE
jgi:hypothetical protein